MSHCSRLPSEVSTNAPLRVPTSTRTPLIYTPVHGLAKPPRMATASLSHPADCHGLELLPTLSLSYDGPTAKDSSVLPQIALPQPPEVAGYRYDERRIADWTLLARKCGRFSRALPPASADGS